jgi:asparagine synthase (glutamine-hydrolysing)
MCGIGAIITNQCKNISDNYKYLSLISDMMSVVKHRGPDGEGTFIDSRGVALGHTRLKIVDLSDDANQPMTLAPTVSHGKYHIVFNGEIYNFLELRERLKKKGYFFKTSSDTEVLLNMYVEYGTRCVDHLNGMFAFVIYDEYRHTVFAARDRYGIKPLYYWISPTGIVAFASEIKQFTMLDGWEAIGNIPRIKDFLYGGVIDHTDETLFEGVYQLRGGDAVVVNVGDEVGLESIRGSVYRWYELEGSNLHDISYDSAVDMVKNLLTDSVKIRSTRADVPVGSCLSGGIDSSSVVCIANEYFKKSLTQNTFTMTSFDDRRYDETMYAREVIDKCKTQQHFIHPTAKGMLETIDQLIWHQDEPTQSTSMYGQFEVFKEVKKSGIKVMLDGQGADEVFVGYHYVFPIRIKILLENGRYAQAIRELIEFKSIPGFKYMDMVRLVYFYMKNKNIRDNTGANAAFSIPTTFKTIGEYSETLIKYTSLPALLHWADRASSAHGVEVRLPFLDYRIVESVLGFADDYKIFDGWTKRCLRDAMFKIIPDKIRLRKDKIGFATAEEVWFLSNVDAFRELFYDAMKVSNGLITHEHATNFENTAMKMRRYDFGIWRAISLGAWIRVFNVKMG